MKFWNLNALQTYLTALAVALPIVLTGFGCTQSATGVLDCSGSMLSPWFTAAAVGLIGAIKLVLIPAMQEGGWARNLFSPKVPLSQSGAPGTVFPEQVQQTTRERN